MGGADFPRRPVGGTARRPTLDPGRVTGKGVPQISQAGSDGWLRKVHAEQGTDGPCSDSSGGLDRSERDTADKVGRDEERFRESVGGSERAAIDLLGVGSGSGTELRGTPQRAQILAAAGLRPGGLR